jgi:hypothetical protein
MVDILYWHFVAGILNSELNCENKNNKILPFIILSYSIIVSLYQCAYRIVF